MKPPKNGFKTFGRQCKIRDTKMTLIIGARFKDGVILVSDRKVTEENSGRETWENKIKSPFSIPMFFGAAGYSHKFKQFNRQIIETVEARQRQIQIENIAYEKAKGLGYSEKEKQVQKKQLSNKDIETHTDAGKVNTNVQYYTYTNEMFIKDCGNLVYELCKGRDGIIRPLLDVLFIMSAQPQTPRLHHIGWDGEEAEMDFCAIGSGAEYIENFLRTFWKENMSIEEILKLCYFCIYYVQDLDLDKGVGIEEGKLPNHVVIANNGEFGEYKGIVGKEIETIREVRTEIHKFKEVINSLPFKKANSG